jgi:hypothetical protein
MRTCKKHSDIPTERHEITTKSGDKRYAMVCGECGKFLVWAKSPVNQARAEERVNYVVDYLVQNSILPERIIRELLVYGGSGSLSPEQYVNFQVFRRSQESAAIADYLSGAEECLGHETCYQ